MCLKVFNIICSLRRPVSCRGGGAHWKTSANTGREGSVVRINGNLVVSGYCREWMYNWENGRNKIQILICSKDPAKLLFCGIHFVNLAHFSITISNLLDFYPDVYIQTCILKERQDRSISLCHELNDIQVRFTEVHHLTREKHKTLILHRDLTTRTISFIFLFSIDNDLVYFQLSYLTIISSCFQWLRCQVCKQQVRIKTSNTVKIVQIFLF